VCQAEQPHLNQLAEEYEGRVAFIGVSNNDTVEDGRAYQDSFGVPYPLANAPEVWAKYGDPYRPTTIVIGQDGSVVARIDGPITLEGLKAELEEALS
jgi:thiol-disulfide isomerase/thioredoxin